MSITAQIVADSVSPQGIRLSTLALRYPRWIHAEFMTHRLFSRNASSSRAVPVKRLSALERQNAALRERLAHKDEVIAEIMEEMVAVKKTAGER